ncbi:hypothetical protein JF50_23610 [Pseudoalteromonas luteoviolacea]|uniref:Lipoprotein n=1 Tax=Pseudoalteromonas luteoviolacea TaxID=43657 RepID=A0A0C1MDF6_9GAMM|nr:hypothetical protein [Pseudoalteromonas luteoviolacea]KID54849.1 hypothetical protein JF50_23610 [Pseudoalteromonas luteoviolacea]
MTRLLYPTLAASITLALAACGGSSGGNNTVQAANQTQQTNTEGAEQVNKTEAQTITLRAESEECWRYQPKQVDIVFHDENGASLGAAQTDLNGNFSGELPVGTKHLSVIGEVDDSVDGEYKYIRTELDIEHRENLGTYYFRTSKECSCEMYKVDDSDLTLTQNGYYLLSNSTLPSNGNIAVCDGSETLYLAAISREHNDAKAAVISLPDSPQTIKISDADFVHHGVTVDKQISDTAQVIGAFGAASDASSLVFNQRQTTDETMPLYIFPDAVEHSYYHQIEFKQTTTEVAQFKVWTSARSKANTEHEFGENEIPLLSGSLNDEILGVSGRENATYDFSTINGDLTRVEFRYSYLVSDNAETRYDWQINGGVKGTIPQLTFGNVFKLPEEDTKLEEFGAYLYGYLGNETDNETYAKLLDVIAKGESRHRAEFNNLIYTRALVEFD